MTAKMTIMLRAVKIRMDRGEDLGVILESYPRLTKEEKNAISREITGKM